MSFTANYTGDQNRLVLAMQTPDLENGLYDWNAFVERTKGKALGFVTRKYLETAPEWMHFIPYVVLRHKGVNTPDTYYTYQRVATSDEGRLDGKYSIGVGGHVELASLKIGEDEKLDVVSTLINTTRTELLEELTFFNTKLGDLNGVEVQERYIDAVLDLSYQSFAKVQVLVDRDFVDQDGSNIGMFHIALIYVIDVDTTDITTNEPQMKHVGLLDACALREIAQTNQLERWSQVVLERLIAV